MTNYSRCDHRRSRDDLGDVGEGVVEVGAAVGTGDVAGLACGDAVGDGEVGVGAAVGGGEVAGLACGDAVGDGEGVSMAPGRIAWSVSTLAYARLVGSTAVVE